MFASEVAGLSRRPSWEAMMCKTSGFEMAQPAVPSVEVDGTKSSVEMWRMAANVEQSEATNSS